MPCNDLAVIWVNLNRGPSAIRILLLYKRPDQKLTLLNLFLHKISRCLHSAAQPKKTVENANKMKIFNSKGDFRSEVHKYEVASTNASMISHDKLQIISI